jgi:hypothetical protein
LVKITNSIDKVLLLRDEFGLQIYSLVLVPALTEGGVMRLVV